jgi:DNA-binding GntR family transcriptional regulator
MSVNPNKRPCSRPGCRAWAMRDSDPPLCNIHAGRARPPRGNQNARKHGFYSPMIHVADLRDLAECIDQLTIDSELSCARLVLRSVLGRLHDLPVDASPADFTRLSGLVLEATRTIARLLRDRDALAAAVTLEQAMEQSARDLEQHLAAGP